MILLPAWSRRWVNAPDYPFPAGDFSIGGYTSHPVRVNSPFYNKCRNKMSIHTELFKYNIFFCKSKVFFEIYKTPCKTLRSARGWINMLIKTSFYPTYTVRALRMTNELISEYEFDKLYKLDIVLIFIMAFLLLN